MTVRLFQQNLPPLFAAAGRGMQFSFSFLYNLIDDIHGRQPVINEGAEWHMSGTDSLLYVESSGKAELEPLLMQKKGPSLKNIYRTKLYETIGYNTWQKFMGNQYDYQTNKKSLTCMLSCLKNSACMIICNLHCLKSLSVLII